MKFKGSLLLSLCAFLLLLNASNLNAQTTQESEVLRHVVSFKFKEEYSQSQIDELVEAFAELENLIPQIQNFEWGINNSPEGLEKGLTHCFIVSFSDEEGRDDYLPHPDHKAFVEKFGPMIEDVFVFDYWVK